MNIFILDTDIQKNAEALCDKHIVKMLLETAQLLCSAFPVGTAPYKRTHYNHPCAIWARETAQNYTWLINYGLALCDEYQFRYGKIHKSRSVIEWCNINGPNLKLPWTNITPFAQALPDQYRQSDAVTAYRAYYKNDKRKIAKWNKNRLAPAWF